MLKPAIDSYEFGPFRLDAVKRLLLRDGETVPITPKALDVLLVLVQDNGQVLEKDELMRRLWPDTVVEEHNLTVNISALRKALGESANQHEYIVTIPGRGYRFATSVNRVWDGSDGQAKSPTEKTSASEVSLRHSSISKISGHKLGAILATVTIVAAAAVAFFISNRGRPLLLTDKDRILLADFDNKTGDRDFDVVLKQALAVQLEQSPFLNIFSDQRVREALRLMSRSPDDQVTKDVAREICERQGLKAFLAGSISNLSSHYVITLEGVNALTGDPLARQQVEAESKEQVLATLGQAATSLREKFGESLASIQKYDVPFAQVTTSSLEAFRAYCLGGELQNEGKNREAIPLFKRAVELDPNFALAYRGCSFVYNATGQRTLAAEAAERAFELRDRTSGYERLKIASQYYGLVTGEIEKSIEALELLKRTYPRERNAPGNLPSLYITIGRYEEAVEEAREHIRLLPDSPLPYRGLAFAFRCLNRFDEAKEVYEQALAKKFDLPVYHLELYRIAFVQGDTAAMQRQLDWVRGKPDEYVARSLQAETAGFLGQLRRARELNQRVADEELNRNLKEDAAEDLSSNVLSDAVVGNCQQAREEVVRASALPRTRASLFRIGVALALCRELRQAQSLADECAKQFPEHTLVNAVLLPALRAAIEIRRYKPAKAIQLLQSATRYDRLSQSTPGPYWPEYLRGQAYLAQHAGAEAAAEFQKILDRRGLAPTSVLYPLAYLGLARAAALTGDTPKSRKAYEDFFALWKDADPDIPVLLEAKREYCKLK